MRRLKLLRLLLLLSFLFLLLAGCRRREEPTPTVAPTAVVQEADTPTAAPSATPEPAPETPAPTAAPTGAPEATLAPEIAPVDPADIDWAPELIYWSPQPGEEALLDGAITMRFDQPMDTESVEAAFAIEAAGGDDTVEGQFEWPRPDTLVFTPRSRLARAASYEVRVAETASGRNGRPLEAPLNLFFDTAGFLEVSQLIPAPGTERVATDASITVLFNRPVVPLVSTGQQADLPQPLEITPAVAGEGEWVSTSIYRFTPDEALAGATEYTVTIPEGLEDIMGGVLAAAESWSFTTAPPSVATMVPEDGASRVAPTAAFTVTFNMPMDQASVESAISLQPSAPLSFSWSDDGRTVRITPDGLLSMETEYSLVVDDTATSANGQATLDRETNSTFTTVPFPAVTSTDPEAGAEAPDFQFGISINFASPMDPETIRGRIEISPEPEDEVNYFVGEEWVNLDFDLQPETEYVVTVPGDVADPYGNTLGADYTWRFTTGPGPAVASLNLPSGVAQLSTSFPTTVDVVYRNVETIDVELFDAGLPTAMLIEPFRVQDYVPGEPLDSWTLEAEDGAGATAVNLAGGAGTLSPGVYFVRVTAPEIDESTSFWQNQFQLLVVADTNLVVKEMSGAVHVWATEMATGEPAAGRDLTLYNSAGERVGTATTDGDGLATLPFAPIQGYLDGVLVVSGELGQAGFGVANSRWSPGVSPWEFGVPATTNLEQPLFSYIYTDRPIYRPGDTVHFRGILRDTGFGRYDLPSRDQVTVSVETFSFFEPNQELDLEETLTVDANGTFSGEFVIPEGAQLGQYRLFLDTSGEIEGAERMFTVAEYRAPEFVVTVTPGQEELLRGESVEVVVEASYFFGGPATDLEVNWSIRQRPYSLPWDGPFYSFDDDDSFYFSYGDDSGFFGNFVREGQGRTDGDGRLVLTLPADLLQEVEEGSRTVTVEATVRDVSEFPVSGRGQVVFHAAESYVGVSPESYLNRAGTETSVDLITVDWETNTLPNQEVDVTFFRRDYRYVEGSGGAFGRWEPEDTEVASTPVTTGAGGRAQATFVPDGGGTFRAVATVTDANGRTQTSSALFWVGDSDFVAWRTTPDAKRMDLTPDQRTYEVGDTASILVQSPFAGPVNAWLILERGEVIEQRLITLNSTSEVLDIPISGTFSPNVFVSVVAVRGVDDAGPAAENGFADIRLGITELVVPPEQLTLDIEMTPQQKILSPGETINYDIKVTDYAGQPVQADLSLALVDLAVLTLKEDNAPPIADAFYARQPYRSSIGSGLFVSGEGLEIEIPEQILGRGGGGGGAAEALAADVLQEEDDGVRRDFPDTAFWRANLITGADGTATVDIRLPDSLTTWRLSAKAVTADSLVGQQSVDIISTLPLLLRPVTPRFFTVGDVVEVGAIANNNSGEALEVTVSLEADGLTLEDAAAQTVSIPAGGQQLVRWTTNVEDVEFVDLTFRAEGGAYSDATKPTLGVGPDQLVPVYRYDAEDIVGTSGVLDEAGRRAEAILLPPLVNTRSGSVDTTLSPSLAAAILDTLDVVNEEFLQQDECAHSVASRLLPNAATAQAIRELGLGQAMMLQQLDNLIPAEISRIEALAFDSGGWGWCFSNERNPLLTAYVVFALTQAQEAGYSVDRNVLGEAVGYIFGEVEEDPAELTNAWEVNRQAYYIYVLYEAGENMPAISERLFAEHRELMEPYAHAMLALSYEPFADSTDLIDQILSDLNNSVDLSATGAHWEESEDGWRNLSSDIFNTAVVLDALTQFDPESSLAPGAVRWLMTARTAGAWSTPYETSWVLLALADWMGETGELDADYAYALNVNGEQVASGQFAEENLAEPVEVSVPISRLPQDDVNFLIYEHGEGDGRLYYTTHLDAFIMAQAVDPVSRGFTVERVYYDADCDPETEDCRPIGQIEAGQRVRVELTVVVPNDRTFVIVQDPIPAGAEAVDPGLATSASDLGGDIERTDVDERFGYWGWWRFDRIEYRDDRVVFFSNFLPAGTYQYTYFLETTIPGAFQVRPATAREEFFPEVFGRSGGLLFEIVE